jgi:iron complex outermembrane receptor protein
MVNAPLVKDMVALRLVAVSDNHTGYSYDVVNHHDLDDLHKWGVRGTLKIDPTEHLDILIRANTGRGHDGGQLTRTVYVDPTNFAATANIEVAGGLVPAATLAPVIFAPPGSPNFDAAQFGAAYGAYLAALPGMNALIQQQLNSSRKSAQQALGYPQYSRAADTGGSITISYNWDALTLKSISAYHHLYADRAFNIGGGPWIPDYTRGYSDSTQWTQELQAFGTSFADRLKYTGGLFYISNDQQESRNQSNINGAFPLFLGSQGLGVTGAQTQLNFPTARSYAGYAQATYALTHSLNFTGGLRWTEEKRDNYAVSIQYPSALLASFGQGTTCLSYTTATAPPVGSGCFVSGSVTNTNVSYTAGVDWSVADNTLLYAKTSRGFRSGGINTYPNTGLPLSTYLPETATDYEVGLKSQWLENRVRLNLAYYHTDYKDIQRPTQGNAAPPGAPANIVTFTRNAASAKIDGAEFEAELIPFERVTLHANAAYTFPKYDRYTQVNPAYPGGIEDLSRKPFQGISRWTYDLAGGYTYPTGIGNLRGWVDWSYRSKANLSDNDVVPGIPGGPVAPASATDEPGYGLLNATLSLNIDKYNSSISFWGKNLTNHQYALARISLIVAGLGTTQEVLGDPRTFGVDFNWRF